MMYYLTAVLYIICFALFAPVYSLGTKEYYKYSAYNSSYLARIPNSLTEGQQQEVLDFISIAETIRARETRPILIMQNTWFTKKLGACGVSYPTPLGCLVVLAEDDYCTAEQDIVMHELLHCYYWEHSSVKYGIMSAKGPSYYDFEDLKQTIWLDYQQVKSYTE